MIEDFSVKIIEIEDTKNSPKIIQQIKNDIWDNFWDIGFINDGEENGYIVLWKHTTEIVGIWYCDNWKEYWDIKLSMMNTWIYVKEEHRSKQYATKMIKAFIEKMKKDDIHKIKIVWVQEKLFEILEKFEKRKIITGTKYLWTDGIERALHKYYGNTFQYQYNYDPEDDNSWQSDEIEVSF